MSLFPETKNRGKLLFNGLLFNLLIFTLLLVLIFVFQPVFLSRFTGLKAEDISLFWVFLSIAFFLFNSLTLSVIYAKEHFKGLFLITLLDALIVIVSVYLASKDSLNMAMIVFALAWGISAILNYLIARLMNWFPPFSFQWDQSTLKLIGGFMLVAASSLIFGKWIDFMVRDFSFDWFGELATGHWQSVARFSDSYRSAFLGTAGLLFYSRVTNILADSGNNSLKSFTFQSIKFLFIGLPILFVFIYLLRDSIIVILFSKEFLPAGNFLHWQLIADLFALPSFLLAYILIASREFILYIKLQFFSALIYVILVPACAALFDNVDGILLANAIRYVIFFFILFVITKKRF